MQRNTYMASLTLLQRQGFKPECVVDVGAAEGGFFLARKQHGLFLDADHFFIDAMVENQAIYDRLHAAFGFGYSIAALSCMEGSVSLEVDPNFYNTHIAGLQDPTYKERRNVRLTTLDRVVKENELEGPFMLKLDVQGGELDVFRGALKTLESSIIVTTEIQLLLERDTIVELLTFMVGRGFSLFDMTDPGYYPSNHVMYQCYVTFIRNDLEFRKNINWCADDQLPGVLDGLKKRRTGILQEIEKLCGIAG